MTKENGEVPLVDQQLRFAPEPHQLNAAGEIDPETDLELVANTWRAIVDQHAFETMIASWNAKLDACDDRDDGPSNLSGPLLTQLAAARRTLEMLDIPAENDPLSRAVQEVPGPAVVLAPDGRIVTTNVAGARAFGGRQGMFFSSDLIDPCSRADFAALRKAANTRGNRSQAILRIHPAEDVEPTFLAEAYLVAAGRGDKSYLVLRSLEVEWTADAGRRLADAFGFSEAEVEVARLFYRLRDNEAVARERGVSVLTVRTQMKAIQAKAETPTQLELFRLLALVASRAVMGERGRVAGWRDPLGREERLTLSDGRVVAWTWMGAEDGVPVVMSRGIPVGYLLPEAEEARLREAGITLFALSRPGYGNSTLDGDMPALDDNLACLRAFLDHRIADPCVAVGLSNGIVPLLAEQTANPARFTTLISIGYTGVLDRSGMHRLPPIPRTMLRLVDVMPWLVELIAKSGHRMMQQYGVDWYLERAYRNRPCDMATCADPNVVPLLRSASAHLLMQGHMTFVRDLQLIRAPIDASIEALTIPMKVLAPMEDGVFDEARYRRLERRNPLVEVEPAPRTGELIYYQNSALVVDHVIRAVAATRAG
ncbi:MAG: alpha/beta hydrolase [Hyphomicrobiales bacterium]|nr:alpha/beta hydrolase [Hyphomicrobiales bacterium]